MVPTPLIVPQLNIVEKANCKPWERKVYTSQQEHKLYCDWAAYFSSTQQLDLTEKFYDKALKLKENDPQTLCFRSVCRRKLAHTHDALDDALKANELRPNYARNSMSIGNAFYELNQFENALVEYYHGRNVYSGSLVRGFLHRTSVVNEQLRLSLGDLLERFFLKHLQYNNTLNEILKNKPKPNTRPLWKVLRDSNECDVLSVLEKNEPCLSPREMASRERSYRIINQIYFERNWVDAIFLNKLRNSERLLLKQFTESKAILINLLDSKYHMVKIFLKMLHSRTPLYCKTFLKNQNKKLVDHLKTKYLNNVQYQTRRIMFITLRQIKHLRKQGKVEELANYIEDVMGDYVVLKTHRVMPWKLEFMNEVYNTLALAFADSHTVDGTFYPKALDRSYKDCLMRLLNIPLHFKGQPIYFQFGNRSTSHTLNGYNARLEHYRKFIARLEKRMLFSKYSIEKTYLWYEMARAHLKQGFFDKCFHIAKKAIDEAKNCNNFLWEFLGQMLIVKSHAAYNKFELCGEALNEAHSICLKLRCQKLISFVETVRQTNEEIVFRQRRRSVETIRKRKVSSMTLISVDEERPSSFEPSE